MSLFSHSEYTTNNGPTSCIPLFHRKVQIERNGSKSEKIVDLLLQASLREKSKWKDVQTWIETPSSMHIDGSPAKDANLICWTATMKKNLSEGLKKSVKALDEDKIYKLLATVKTTWKFNPPHGPHFGGMWERLIQSAKRTLLIILESKRLSFQTSSRQ